MLTKQRLVEYLNSKQITKEEFCRDNAVFFTFFESATVISDKQLVAFSEKYPDLNLDWLLTGRGYMLIITQILEVTI